MRSEKVRKLLDLLPVLLILIKSDGSIVWANRAFRDRFLTGPNGPSPLNVTTVLADTGNELPALIHEAVGSGRAMAGIVLSVPTPDKAIRTLKTDILPCTGKEYAGHAILSAIDISREAELETLKKDAYDQIEKNIEQLAVLGDRIRNPVTVISGLCDLLDDRNVAEKIQSQAMEIDQTVRMIDQGWIESEKVRSILRKYYSIGVSGTHELVARAIHEEYLAQMREAGQTQENNPSIRPWDELDRGLKESNLRQADDIWKKLSRIRCGIGIMVDNRSPPFTFTAGEVEQLAILEHERWIKEKTRNGWRCGQAINVQEKTHTCLVPWQHLPEDQKQKDRNTIRTLPAILARVRLKIVRLDTLMDPAEADGQERV